MTDFLEEKKREIKSRIDEIETHMGELQKLADERDRLQLAYDALSGVESTPARRSSSASKPRRKAASGGGGTGKRGRPKGSGSRAKEALQLVKDRPGITIPEIAEAMDMKQNYLYRVMPDLQKEGLVKKEGRGWHALEAA